MFVPKNKCRAKIMSEFQSIKASVTTGLDVVTVLRTTSILLYKEYSQPSVAVNSKYPPYNCKFLLIKPSTHHKHCDNPPALLCTIRKVRNFSFNSSGRYNSRPRFFDMTILHLALYELILHETF